jgi:pyridoxal phosphate enzyme (YggS family)
VVRGRLVGGAHRSGRTPSDIRLIAVSKTFPADDVLAAAVAGQRDFGENRVQEAVGKIEATASANLPADAVAKAGLLEWHLIGHLQSNKAKKAAAAFAWIHSIDSVDLVEKIDGAAADARTTPRVLIQVDLAHEATKSGADAADVPAVARAALAGRAVELAGLMIVPPIATDPEDARPWFRQLRELRDRLVADGIPAGALRELSMGMSHDFEVAIEEGATMVRVGSAIFGKRDYAAGT